MSDEEETRDLAIFEVLANELPGDDPKKTNGKIKRKLDRAHLGPHDPERVSQLRALHDALRDELMKASSSQYYRGTPGSLASPAHFDTEKMVRDYLLEYPWIAEHDLSRIIGFAVYFYYLR